MMSRLTIIRGLPGSGKSTFAKTLGCVHFEADMFFVRGGCYMYSSNRIKNAHSWCSSMVRQCLAEGMDVVVSNTFTKLWELEPYLSMDSNAKVYCCKGNYGNTHAVPQEVISKMEARWQDYEGEEIV